MHNLKKYSVSLLFVCFLTGIFLFYFILPKNAYSENEKRVLADFPKITWSSVTDGSFGKKLETFLADHFPFRDTFVGIHAYTELLFGRNGISGVYKGQDGYLIAEPATLDISRAKQNVENITQFVQSTGLPGSVMVVPSPGYILEEKLPQNHKAYWDDTLMNITMETAGDITVLDLRNDFLKQKSDIYYRTDHHLTSFGTYQMYQIFCKEQGLTPVEFACTERYEGFYGTAYSKSGLWGTAPDTIEIWRPEVSGQYQVTIQDGHSTKNYQSLYFNAHLENMDKYPVFLDGNHSLVTVKNENCQNGKRLLLIKDSYAHCFATFAIEHYEEIVMVDMRYFRNSVQDIIDNEKLNEILILYGAENLATSTDISWLMPVQ